MKTYTVKCLALRWVTHDCFQLDVEKPEGFTYKSGHSTMLSIQKEGLENLKRPYTFVSTQHEQMLSFIIKDYVDLDGLSTRLKLVKPGDALTITDAFGSINYSKKGVFIAGGVGITPFLAILRDLHVQGKTDEHILLYSSKEHKDIIAENELRHYLGDNAIFLLTREEREGYLHQRIDKDLLEKYYGEHEFYICGSAKFNATMRKMLRELKVEKITVMDM